MAGGGRDWTPEEMLAIRDVPHGDLGVVAKRLGRSYKAVVQQRMKFGLSRQRPDWRLPEDKFVDSVVAAGGSVASAARALHRCIDHAAVRYRRRHGRRR